MATKQQELPGMRKTSVGDLFFWLLLIVWFIVIPIMTQMTLHAQQKHIETLEDYLIRTNKNEQVLNNKLDQLHDDMSGNSFQFQLTPQDNSQVN